MMINGLVLWGKLTVQTPWCLRPRMEVHSFTFPIQFWKGIINGFSGGSLTDIAVSDDLGARPKNRKWVLTIWNSPITYSMCPVVLEATYSLGMHISTSIGGLNRVSQKSLKHLPLSKGSNHGWHINQHQPTSGASMDIYGWLKTCCLTNIHLHIPTSRTPIIPLRFWRQLSHSFAVSPFFRNVHPTIIRPSSNHQYLQHPT